MAIFVDEDNKVTHAGRHKVNNGMWSSKLGREWDIEHASPFDLEGEGYGTIAIILIRPFS